MERKRVGIVIFNDVEVLDFCGPFEVFSVVRLDEDNRRDTRSPFEVTLLAEHEHDILTAGGMSVAPHYSFAQCPPLDIMIVPGGWGTRREMTNKVLLDWLKITASRVETLASVCTGAMLLAKAGLLDGHRATTHWKSLTWISESFPKIQVQKEKHYVKDGRVYTSAGISAGIDMSLEIVAEYCGEKIARATAKHMEYPFPEDDKRKIEIPD